MNNWNIPESLENEVINRDKKCIYCGVGFEQFQKIRKFKPSWEHIINDASIITRENIARCCVSCNSSKGTKELSDWLESAYCRKYGINRNTIAEVAQKALGA
jgi:5-methylcytosine-specific restriction endonuclease McrA